MTALESRKRLLLAESALNRAQIMLEWQMMTSEVHALVKRAGTLSSLVSAAATLGAGVGLCGRKPPAPVPVKASWLQTFLKGADVLCALWPKFRPPGQD